MSRTLAIILLGVMFGALITARESKHLGPNKYPDFWRAFGVINKDCTK